MSLSAGGRGLGAVWSPTHVQVTVLQARGLRAKGPGGTSDAYALIQVGKEKYATSVSERSLGAPVWREEATFELPPLGLPAGAGGAATLQLTVLHRALLGLDKFLGRAEVDLRELHRDQGRRKTQWYTLKSKPGKKEKERGEIEVDIQFMRNNITASMFDLSVKDKSRNPFGKLKDKIKGKRQEEPSDTASAIIPSTMHTIESDDDDSPTKDKKKKSKIKTLFSRSGLQKTPLSQSMSVLPTSKPEKLTLRPGDFQSQWEDDVEDESSSPSDSMSHRRTASADIKQLSQINFTLPKKEGLSFFGGLRSKNDQLSRSNVCINGNHIYVEQPEPKNESVTKDSTPSSSPSPQGFRKKHLFSSTENLSSRPSKEWGETGRISPDRRLSGSFAKDSFRSLTLPSYKPVVSGDVNVTPVNTETEKESKENKKQESKKSSLLSLVTGKKDSLKNSETESSIPGVLVKEKEITPVEAMAKEREEGLVEIPVKDLDEKPEDLSSSVSRQSKSPSPTEEVTRMQSGAEPEPKPRPPALSAKGPQTKAVKPRLGVTPEAPSKAKLPPSLCDSSFFFSTSISGSNLDSLHSNLGQKSETESSNLSVLSSFSPPTIDPVSTSTPIENWPFSQESQTSSEPSFLLAVKSQKEGLIQVSNASSSSSESLDKHSPVHERNGVSREEIGEIDVGKSRGSRESSRPSLEIMENTNDKQLTKEQKEEKVPTFSQVSSPEYLPPSKVSQQNSTLIQDRSDSGKLWKEGSKELASSCGSSLEDQVSEVGIFSSNEGAELPHKMEDLTIPLDSIVGKSNLTGVHEREGCKKIKKRVSFSEELFSEEEVEKPIYFMEKEKSKPRELKSNDIGSENVKKTMITEPESLSLSLKSGATAVFRLSHDEPASMTGIFVPFVGSVLVPESQGKNSSGQLVKESSSEKATPSFRIERYENYSENYQSKASDHEGLLSDPLKSLNSVSDLRSPVMGDLNLTLPSIPEVTSDDERVEQLEDVRMTPTTKNHMDAEIPFFGSLAVSSEMENQSLSVGLSSEIATLLQEEKNTLQVQKPEALVNSAPLSSRQSTAMGICKLSHGEGVGVDTDIPSPVSLEKQERREDEKYTEESSSPRSSSQGSPVSGHSLSENSNVTHSFPGSLHSDTYHTNRAESPQKTTAESLAAKVENSDKKKQLLRAWVSPSEPHLFPAQPTSGTTVSAKHRTHPVKPMNTTATKTLPTSLGTATIINENLFNEAIIKKYKPSDPEFAYTQLTHDELIQLVLKQKETINKKEFQVRELEDYIDNLLVRVMEETPNILRCPAQLKNKAGKM
ncbi:rab11 family-interacting protein 1 isoform X1 [Sminthopsis crassicaudata]|uniref:rab11 family-interacting protein 1 isoform X1 n=1 Tax=Sminthopsis crassicaudata TaxID=9301 RepID=UPI003D690625